MLAADWEVGFACSLDTLSLLPLLAEGFDVFQIPQQSDLAAEMLLRRWPSGCDVLVVDHYQLGRAFEAKCRGWARRIVVIDDLANREHDCDLLVDATLCRCASDYVDLVSRGTVLCIGPAFALVRPDFAALRSSSIINRATRRQRDCRVLVSFGLTDIGGVTEQVVRELLALPFDFAIDVLMGGQAASRDRILSLAKVEQRVRVHVDCDDVAALMAVSDIAVGAGGTTSWERCALGLPTVLFVLADNQQVVGANLEKAGAAVIVRTPISPGRNVISDPVTRLAQDPSRRMAMAAAAAAVSDGRGVERVYQAITRLFEQADEAKRSIGLRRASLEDSILIWAWRNDFGSRANSKNDTIVIWEEHDRWFKATLKSDEAFIYVGIAREEPFGVVRFDYKGHHTFMTSINISPQNRNAGLGKKLLLLSCDTFKMVMPNANIVAEIRILNTASRRLFEAAGFCPLETGDELVVYRRQ